MAANTSSAVMASNVTPVGALELFPTPPWTTRTVCIEVLAPRGLIFKTATAWDPCCGKGHMAIPLRESFPAGVFASDVHDWGFGDRRDLDFTFATAADIPFPIDWVIANPPFKLAEAFLDRGLMFARKGVALLLRLQWIEGVGRFERVFGTDRRPAIVAPLAERAAMIEGVWDPQASSATAYAWFIFTREPVRESIIVPIRPGAAKRHTHLADRPLATPGEARRRLAAKRAARAAEEGAQRAAASSHGRATA